MKSMTNLIFAFLAAPGEMESQALMLAESIRTFAGEFADNPIWVLTPQAEDLSTGEALSALGVRRVPFDIDPAAQGFPFAAKVFASAAAEARAQAQSEGRADLLAWMDTGALVVGEPRALLLEEGKALGYRPVDHILIGPPYDAPLDPFWELIYRRCGVPEGRAFPMTASADQNRMRPYFNAGLLVVRPAHGLMQRWRDDFRRLFRAAEFEAFYAQNVLYRIFVHQAVLAGTLLASLDKAAMQELPHLVNYPLHMHAEYPPDLRPASVNELISFRYEEFFKDPNWAGVCPAQEPLASWLSARLGAAYHYHRS
ncbi:MAG: hypothetical protein JXB47_13165 [Anaerolineae bacterium]|nr:hypothetical protein [Anaerolineae bacterium]